MSSLATYNRCDFESGLCDWVQMTDDDLDWNTMQASTSAYLKFDHTLDSERGKDTQLVQVCELVVCKDCHNSMT